MSQQFSAHQEEEDVFTVFTNMSPPYDEGFVKFEHVPSSDAVHSGDARLGAIQSWRPVVDSPPASTESESHSAPDSLTAAFEKVINQVNAVASRFTLSKTPEKTNEEQSTPAVNPNAEPEPMDRSTPMSLDNLAVDAFLMDGPRENTAWTCPIEITPHELLVFFPHETNTVYGITKLFQASWTIEEITLLICIGRGLVALTEVEKTVMDRFQRIVSEVLRREVSREEVDAQDIRDEFIRKAGKLPTPQGTFDPSLEDLARGTSIFPQGEEGGILTRAIRSACEHPGGTARLSGVGNTESTSS